MAIKKVDFDEINNAYVVYVESTLPEGCEGVKEEEWKEKDAYQQLCFLMRNNERKKKRKGTHEITLCQDTQAHIGKYLGGSQISLFPKEVQSMAQKKRKDLIQEFIKELHPIVKVFETLNDLIKEQTSDFEIFSENPRLSSLYGYWIHYECLEDQTIDEVLEHAILTPTLYNALVAAGGDDVEMRLLLKSPLSKHVELTMATKGFTTQVKMIENFCFKDPGREISNADYSRTIIFERKIGALYICIGLSFENVDYSRSPVIDIRVLKDHIKNYRYYSTKKCTRKDVTKEFLTKRMNDEEYANVGTMLGLFLESMLMLQGDNVVEFKLSTIEELYFNEFEEAQNLALMMEFLQKEHYDVCWKFGLV